MKRIAISLLLIALAIPVFSQLKMRDVLAEMPDSILPLLTKNNRLDCIDFIENNMTARVKNRYDQDSELKRLTEDYMQMQITAHSSVEMKLIQREQDTLLCMVRTYTAPAADSDVVFYNLKWEELDIREERPQVEDFLEGGADVDAVGLLKSLPLMRVSLSPDEPALTYELQLGELTKQQREALEGKVHKITHQLYK